MRLRRTKLARVSHPASPPARGGVHADAAYRALVSPPIALTVDVSTPILAEIGTRRSFAM